MSGYKRATVTISEQEYRRLHQTDMKRRFTGHTRVKTKPLEQPAERNLALERMEERQQQLEQALGDLGQNLGRVEAEMVQDILRQNARGYESLAAALDETAAYAGDAISQLSEAFSDRMQQQRDEYLRGLHGVVQHIEAYAQAAQAREEVAGHWLERAEVLAGFVQSQFDHERFLPGRLPRILRSLDMARGNLAEGFVEASLQSAQQGFLQLSELHFELEQRLLEWQAEYDAACGEIRQVINEIELNSSVHGIGLQGEELPDRVDVDYWTEGKYRQLLQQCQGFLQLLEDRREQISTKELRRIHTKLDSITIQLFESIVCEARLNALNSQLRMNIAERALQALENQGFMLGESGYSNEDMRASFVAHLDNPDGSQVTVEVIPTDNTVQELTNELVVITRQPYLKTEHEVRLQWQELCRSLNEDKLNVSRPEVRAAPPVDGSEQSEQPTFVRETILRSER
jgi:hypothetical protein